MDEKNAHSNIHSSIAPDAETPPPQSDARKYYVDGERENVPTYSAEIDGMYAIGLNQEELAFYSSFTPAMRRSLNRKVDIRLIPMLALLYLISNLDRANIGNAKIEGMEADLNLTGIQYNTALAIFFVSYMIFEIPSNAIFKQLRSPSYYLGGCTLAFGLISCMQGVVKNYAGLVACRFLLGIFEAGFFPAAIYLCTAWYLPSDLGVRLGALFCMAALSGAFSGLLAAGITQMDGVGGYEGWRWIFIIEGIATLVIGFAAFFLLLDLPSPSTSWLSADEVQFLELQRKLKQGGINAKGLDVEGGATGFHWRELRMVLTNLKQWVLVTALTCQAIGVYGVKFHLPTLTKTMGFSSTHAQLLSVPPYILACAACIVIPRLSDRYKNRGYFVVGSFAIMIIGWVVVTALQGNFSGSRLAPGYVFICFSVVGNFATSPLIFAWGNNNTAPAGRRAMVSAFLNTVCNFGGIIGSFMYLNKEAPVYNTGNGITIAAGVVGCVCAIVLHLAWKRMNRENGQRKKEEVRSTYSDDDLLRLGDRSPFFRYME